MNGLIRKECPDRSKINLHDPLEARSWSHKLDVSIELLSQVIDKVGNAAAAVKKELEREKGNGRA